MIIEALLQSVKRVFYVSLLLFIILYIYATIGSILFSEDIPSRWGNVGTAMITLFQVLTLSSWEHGDSANNDEAKNIYPSPPIQILKR